MSKQSERRSSPLPTPVISVVPSGTTAPTIADLTQQIADLTQKQQDILLRLDDLRQQSVKDLVQRYGSSVQKPGDLAGPKKLLDEEIVLLAAFARNKYLVSGEESGSGRWHGLIECQFHLRDTCFIWQADSRLDLLSQFWQGGSDQEGIITLAETDLQGDLWKRQRTAIMLEYQQQCDDATKVAE